MYLQFFLFVGTLYLLQVTVQIYIFLEGGGGGLFHLHFKFCLCKFCNLLLAAVKNNV